MVPRRSALGSSQGLKYKQNLNLPVEMPRATNQSPFSRIKRYPPQRPSRSDCRKRCQNALQTLPSYATESLRPRAIPRPKPLFPKDPGWPEPQPVPWLTSRLMIVTRVTESCYWIGFPTVSTEPAVLRRSCLLYNFYGQTAARINVYATKIHLRGATLK